MAVPYSLGRRIVLSSKQSRESGQFAMDQSGELYQLDGAGYMKVLPNESDKLEHMNNSENEF